MVHVDHLKPYEGHSIPSIWQYIQIDTTQRQLLPDINESTNSENRLDDSTSEPYVSMHGRQIVRQPLYRPIHIYRSLSLSRRKSDYVSDIYSCSVAYPE